MLLLKPFYLWECDLMNLAGELTIIGTGPGRVSISRLVNKYLDFFNRF